MKKIKAIVFDLDGTLLDTIGDIAYSLNNVLVRNNFKHHSISKVKSMVGNGLKNLTRAATADLSLSDEAFNRVYEEFQEEYRSHPTDLTAAYKGVESMLQELKPLCSLFILSNKEHKMTIKVVDTLLESEIFQEIHGMKPEFPGKPDPQVLINLLTRYNLKANEVLFLGDSEVDMATARGAGVVACGALWGFREEGALREAGADFLFSSPQDFKEFVKKNLENDQEFNHGPE